MSVHKIYVGNISYQTTEEDLKGHFEQAGEVLNVKIITDRDTGRNRGFGFIEMTEEGVNNAIAQLNDKDFMGRNLKVSVAKDNNRRSRPNSY